MRKSKSLFICALILLLGYAPVALGDWDPNDGHKMLDGWQPPDPCGWDICLGHQYLADDFVCAESGPITDIHFWISFRGDSYDTISGIEAYIFDDNEGQPGFEPTWMWNGTGQVTVVPYGTGQQGWYCPYLDYTDPCDHTGIWQINITEIADPFEQIEGTRYWLVIGAWTEYFAESAVGWKTSLTENGNPAYFYDSGQWYLLEPWGQMGWTDMAFVITGELDYGDAPDPTYPTLSASDGARHVADGTTFLGAKVDIELDGQPHPLALGDDNDGNDDEDGVTFTSLITPGDPCATVDVIASAAGLLNAWLDFNADGDWADPCEQIFTNTVLAAGTNSLTYTVPGSATLSRS